MITVRGLAGALIAATVVIHGLGLATFNARHYPMVEQVVVPYRR
jgi:predicted nucleic acid-binding protein